MLYRKYGRTGKELSVLGFGGMRIEKVNGRYDFDKCAEVIRKANELGINYFDTAPSYNDFRGEQIFGHAFQDMPSQYYVSTKSMETDGSQLRRQLETSLKRLGVAKIDFYYIWRILTLEDYRARMVKGGAFDAALKAKEEGLIEHLAFSTHCSGEEIETIIQEGCFEGVTLGYNIINFPYRQQGLRAAFQNKLGVVTMNPLGGGMIPRNSQYFDFIRSTEEETVTEAALRFNAAHEEITTVLSGMTTIEEVVENVKAMENPGKLPGQKISNIANRLFSFMDSFCTGCRYCEPCPKGLEISKFMIGYNQKMLGGVKAGLNWIKWHWGIPVERAQECLQCGECEGRCTQHLPIIERMNEISVWK